MRALLAPALALVLALPGDARPPSATRVQLAVSVQDNGGRPVPTLSAADFTIIGVRLPSAKIVTHITMFAIIGRRVEMATLIEAITTVSMKASNMPGTQRTISA